MSRLKNHSLAQRKIDLACCFEGVYSLPNASQPTQANSFLHCNKARSNQRRGRIFAAAVAFINGGKGLLAEVFVSLFPMLSVKGMREHLGFVLRFSACPS
jgi:hypothetical protein